MNTEIINQKLSQIYDYFSQLEQLILKFPKEEVLSDSSKRLIAERLLQLIVDTMLDINIQVIIDKNKIYDQTRSTFIILGELGVFPQEFANKIAPIIGLRNILVHRYEKLDKELFVKNLFQNSDDIKNYAKYISDFISQN
ncbi:MAG: DUF86 domain-containing protein [Patescibacteria group bacterium]